MTRAISSKALFSRNRRSKELHNKAMHADTQPRREHTVALSCNSLAAWLRAGDGRRSVRKMKKDSRIISRGPFKGKRIEFAPTTGINRFRAISEDFMNRIFGLGPGEYLISDESSLYDFTSLDEMELPDIHKKIQGMYNIDVSDIKSKNLLEIFRKISDSKSRASC